MERDIAKVATLIVFGAILVDIGTHGDAFAKIFDIVRRIWLGSVSVVAGGSASVA